MKLLILDGNSIANRAYYGVRPLNAPDGTPTNAVYGFLTILQKLVTEESPDAVCVMFDEHAPTFRKERYDLYKAQRKGMDEELRVQMPILRQVLEAMRIPCYSLAGYEADDLIGTAAARAEAAGWESAVATGDRDSFQLITEKTKIKHVHSRQGLQISRDYTPEVFREEYGFEPLRIVDLKALMGDASDNIPGVPGVGEKTAMTLVREYGTMQKLYEDLPQIPIRDSVKKKLEDGRESAELSYWLATICRDVPFEFTPEANLRREPDNDALYRLFTTLQFTKMIERYGLTPPREASAGDSMAIDTRKRERVADPARVLDLLRKAPWTAVTVAEGFSAFAASLEETDYLFTREGTADYEAALRSVLGGEVRKAGHEVKELMRACLFAGIETGGWEFDTALGGYLLDPTASDYGLTGLGDRWCGIPAGSGETEDGQLTLESPGEDERLLADAARIRCLRPVMEARLEERGQTALLRDVEMPLCRVLAEMEYRGVLVDVEALKAYGEGLQQAADAAQQTIWDLAGHEFNIHSPRQLGEVLFAERKLPPPKRTKTGWATGAEVLEKLRGRDPIVQQILDSRELTKLKSTYADGLLRVVGEDGRIHTHFQMTVTATGRLSSVEPNLQNIPVRRQLGGEIRRMFTAGDGCVFVDADWSQIELRLLAHISGDEAMREAFRKGEDVHAVTASQVFDVPLEEVTSTQRSRAKAVNFGIVYGISGFSLAQNIGVTPGEAKAYIDAYLAHYAGIREYMKRVVEQAAADGYVSTVFGRRRDLPELKSSNANIRAFGERVALNMPVQGTAADLMKIAMIRVRDRLEREGLRGRLVLQIHDELIVECPEAEAETVARVLREEMESAADLSVPLTAEAGWGKTWYEAK